MREILNSTGFKVLLVVEAILITGLLAAIVVYMVNKHFDDEKDKKENEDKIDELPFPGKMVYPTCM